MTPPRRLHVAIVDPRYVPLILSGAKTIECRLTRSRVPPFECAEPDERVYFKARSGIFRCAAVICKTDFIALAGPDSVTALRAEHDHAIRGDEAYWPSKADARFASLIHLRDPEPIECGPDLAPLVRPGDRRAWHVFPVEVGPQRAPGLFDR